MRIGRRVVVGLIGLVALATFGVYRSSVRSGAIRPTQSSRDRPPQDHRAGEAASVAARGAELPPARTERVDPPEDRWRRGLRLPPSIARDAELADILQEVADTDVDLAAALLLSVGLADRQRIVAAVLLDSSRHPAQAAKMAEQFVAEDRSAAADHGYALVSALSRVGEYQAALTFVTRQSLRTGGAEEEPAKWLRALFRTWAEHDRDAARSAARALTNDAWRVEALRAIEETAAQ